MTPRHWKIVIPVRPKAVQAVRGGRRGFYADKKVLAWKNVIRPYIRRVCKGPPSKLPIRAVALRYIFKLPQSAPKHIVKFVEQGGYVPYLMQIDITDNLSKGVIDVCKGLVFEDDSQIWDMSEVKKLYGINDRIELEFEETPDVVLLHAKGEKCESENQLQGDGALGF